GITDCGTRVENGFSFSTPTISSHRLKSRCKFMLHPFSRRTSFSRIGKSCVGRDKVGIRKVTGARRKSERIPSSICSSQKTLLRWEARYFQSKRYVKLGGLMKDIGLLRT